MADGSPQLPDVQVWCGGAQHNVEIGRMLQLQMLQGFSKLAWSGLLVTGRHAWRCSCWMCRNMVLRSCLACSNGLIIDLCASIFSSAVEAATALKYKQAGRFSQQDKPEVDLMTNLALPSSIAELGYTDRKPMARPCITPFASCCTRSEDTKT